MPLAAWEEGDRVGERIRSKKLDVGSSRTAADSSPQRSPRSIHHRRNQSNALSSSHSSRSPSPPQFRIANLKGFLPLSDNVGTVGPRRGAALPTLLGGGLMRKHSGIWFHEHERDHRREIEELERKKRESGVVIPSSGLGTSYDYEHSIATPRKALSRKHSHGGEDRDGGESHRHEHDNESLDDADLHLTFGSNKDLYAFGRRLSKMDSHSHAEQILMAPQMRSQRLIGNANPRYRWAQYWKTDEDLKGMKKPIRKYYERTNSLIQQYTFIDRLLDSSLPHDLIQEYKTPAERRANEQLINHEHSRPETIPEESGSLPPTPSLVLNAADNEVSGLSTPQDTPSRSLSEDLLIAKATSGVEDAARAVSQAHTKVKRTPKNLYKIPEGNTSSPHERTPLLKPNPDDLENPHEVDPPEEASVDFENKMPDWEPEEEADSQSKVVAFAIYLNLAANTILLILKIIVTIMTSSVSVLASLVDAALDFLSTGIVFVTTRLIAHGARDREKYPVGRRRLEPIGVLVFSVIMITAFVQVAIEGFKKMTTGDHIAISLSTSAVIIMASTVGIKGLCWLYCKAIRNSSVQALAQDAMTDVIFNTFSIIFPLVGYYANIWYLDPLGGILLAAYVILSWSRTSVHHIDCLAGAAAPADQRNVLLYLTMRFARPIRQIQGLNAYHAGDKLNVEADIVLDEATSLRDSHDLGESLQYVLEGVPTVDRAFVHLDYEGWNVSLAWPQVPQQPVFTFCY